MPSSISPVTDLPSIVRSGLESYLMSTERRNLRNDDMIRADGIALNEIVVRISDAAKVSLVFVDACRKDRVFPGWRSRPRTSEAR